MEFNAFLSGLQDWAQNWPRERADDMSEIAKEAIHHGWYMNEALLFVLYRDLDDYDDFDSFMEETILSDWDGFWDAVLKVEPSRVAILKEAKQCFELGCYAASIHVLFSQADGIFHDQFGKSLYKKQGERAKVEISGYITDFIARDSLETLVDHYKDASILRRMFNEVYTAMFSVTAADPMKNIAPSDLESELLIPNRHGVLHGMHRSYGSKTNALKVFALLLFVIYSIHGEKMLGLDT
ncbi:hypothetical protein [Photobacterium leiognathi]|nr:hypothetical protein [Photobacterium leiognathi]